MIRFLAAFLLMVGLAVPAEAQAVRVTAGEHEGFTRVVLDYPRAVDWQVGRTEDGYELRLAGEAMRYDLTRAFTLIGRERLSGLWADPESGALRLEVGCACHALPFALRDDTVVIDLRDGSPPPEWGFETGFDGLRKAPLRGRAPAVAQNYPAVREETSAVAGESQAPPVKWDWAQGALAAGGSDAPTPVPPLPDARIGALRQALVESFAKAATQDLVDPVEKLGPRERTGVKAPMAEMRLGGVEVRPASEPEPDLAREGALCPGDTSLALQDWGDARPIHEQMADATASLAGEFDRTQPDALYRAVRFQLFLGFGAEARGLMRAFDGPMPERALWTTLSYLVDGGTDPEGAFKGLAGCDDAAALWATVADPALPLGAVNTPALLRSFSALPPHLRLGIGPSLAERFMTAGDGVTAQALSDALLRPHDEEARRTVLMQARFAIEAGDYAAADAALAPLVADAGPLAVDVLVTQVELAARTGAALGQEVVTTVESLLREAGEEESVSLRRALVLARALSGDFDSAFAALAESAETAPDLWHLLAEKGPDEALLAHALTDDPALRDALPAETRRKVAERLLTLGFADAAGLWAGADDPLLSARAALMTGEPERVLQILGAADGEEAKKLKAEALLQVDAAAAVPAFEGLGDADAAARAARLAEAWPELAANQGDAWGVVAGALSPASTPSQTLARSRALVDSAQGTRAAVDALLKSVPLPVPE